uniref:Putative secreted protein n=1 Tax=Anopheles triannulatus TaxID=58253 RepID=A0A2M4B4U4_9DIPT
MLKAAPPVSTAASPWSVFCPAVRSSPSFTSVPFPFSCSLFLSLTLSFVFSVRLSLVENPSESGERAGPDRKWRYPPSAPPSILSIDPHPFHFFSSAPAWPPAPVSAYHYWFECTLLCARDRQNGPCVSVCGDGR